MLTPVDIENKEFTKAFRGYDIYEVEEFMKDLITDYEKLYRDNAELKEKNAVLNEAISSYKGMEETMQNAILVAQRTAEDIKQNAYERSETIIKEAERKAAEAVNNANRSISNLEKTYLNMQREMNGFKAKMNSLLSTYMQLLSDLSDKNPSPFLTVNVPEVPDEPVVKHESDSAVTEEDTHRFTLSSLVSEKESEPEKAAEQAVSSQTKEEIPDFAPVHKVNPLVEELMQKNREQAATVVEETKEENFSFVKETVEKEAAPAITSIDLEGLKNFDVFSDDSL